MMFNEETMNGKIASSDNMRRSFLTMGKNTALDIENLNKDVISFLIYFNQYANIMYNMFEWNTPDKHEQINDQFIERLNFYRGSCALIRDKDKGFLIADYVKNDKAVNMFGYPTFITAMDVMNNGKMIGQYSSEDFVIIPNNYTFFPTMLTVWKYANDFANIEEAVDNNTHMQQFPLVLSGTREQKQALKQIMSHFDYASKYIFADKDLNVDDIHALDTHAPFVARELMDVEDRKKNQLLTMLGLNNENINKMSGISDAEVEANNQLVSLTMETMLRPRQKACEEAREKFGIEMDVKINEKYILTPSAPEETEDVEEVEE